MSSSQGYGLPYGQRSHFFLNEGAGSCTAGITNRRGAIVLIGCVEQLAALVFIRGAGDDHIGNAPQIAQVINAMVGGAVLSD